MSEVSKRALPTSRSLVRDVIVALEGLGGRASSREIDDKVKSTLGLPPATYEILHDASGSRRSEIDYRLAWARTYAKKKGLVQVSLDRKWMLVD